MVRAALYVHHLHYRAATPHCRTAVINLLCMYVLYSERNYLTLRITQHGTFWNLCTRRCPCAALAPFPSPVPVLVLASAGPGGDVAPSVR
jgi:hypothetical protein